jgi:hypothetical protein
MRRPMHGNVPLTYSEILRVVGQYLDRSNLSEIRVLETDEGLILQGLVMDGPKAGERTTYEVTVEDIEELFQDEYAQRGKQI